MICPFSLNQNAVPLETFLSEGQVREQTNGSKVVGNYPGEYAVKHKVAESDRYRGVHGFARVAHMVIGMVEFITDLAAEIGHAHNIAQTDGSDNREEIFL